MKLVEIDFNGDTLISIKNEQTGEVYVSMKHICNSIGISWQGQNAKLTDNGKRSDRYYVWGCKEIFITTNGIEKETIVIPVKNLNGWLLQLNSRNVKSDAVREKLIRYQQECFQVLYDYWNKGAAVNPRIEEPFDIFGPTMNMTDPRVSAKLVKIIEAYHEANVERQKLKNKLNMVLGSKKSKLVQDFFKELNVTTQDGQIVPIETLYQLLRNSGYFRKYHNIPYQQFSNDEMFGKVELPKTGTQGAYIIIQELLRAGYMINNHRVQQLLVTNERTNQQMLPHTQTAVTIVQEEPRQTPNLNMLESEPVLIPPFVSKTIH
jgi:hypothetical protein